MTNKHEIVEKATSVYIIKGLLNVFSKGRNDDCRISRVGVINKGKEV